MEECRRRWAGGPSQHTDEHPSTFTPSENVMCDRLKWGLSPKLVWGWL